MKDTKALADFIGAVYDTVLKPDAWPGVLERLCQMLDAKAASVHVVNPLEGRASLFVEHGTDPVWTALLLSRYANMSPIGAAVLLADLDEPIGAFDFIDEDEFVESQFYREWCAPQGYHDMLGALIAKRPREVGAVSATRLKGKGRFGDEERTIIRLVAPHVRRAVTISGLLDRRQIELSAFASVMDQLSAAVLLVDRSGKILRANGAAQRLCDSDTVICERQGSVALSDAEANQAVKAALMRQGSDPQMIGARGRDGAAYLVAVMSVHAQSGTAAVLINPQEAEQPAIGKHIAGLFGLTPRELCVLMPLLEGRTIDEIAAGMGIAVATAKSHLDKVFSKTGTNRQADLVQKVLRAIPPVALKG